jgi:hypothetical protein
MTRSAVLRIVCICLLMTVAFSLDALADRGAFTVDIGAGGTTLGLSSPYGQQRGSVQGTSTLISFGTRYALQNYLELSVNAFLEPPVTYFHNGVTITTPDGLFAGTLKHRFSRYGVLAGGRLVTGKVWRFVAGADVGWSHRAYSEFQHIKDDDPSNPRDYRLNLPDLARNNWVLAVPAGIEWAAGDHWSLSFLSRYEQLLGPDSTFAISARLLFSWSWYL